MGMDPWSPFREVMADPLQWARSWKDRTGGKVIGHLLPDVPEEMIHAAGALPLALEGARVAASKAQASLPGYTCSHAMGLLEMGLAGQLDFLDGLIIPYVCDTTRNLYHTWSHTFPQSRHEFLRLPKRLYHPGAREYLRAELERFGEALGRMTGRYPSLENITLSLSVYQKSRSRLRKAYALHRERPSIWTWERVNLLMASAMKAPREEHLSWMEKLPWEIEQGRKPNGRVPVYVRGKIWDPPEILEMMDELGLLVVGDEMVCGFRSIAGDYGQGDPLEALVSRLISLPLYPGYHDEPGRIVQSFLDRVQESGAKGVIFLNPKFCEAAGFELPDLQKALEKEKIPALVLETSTRGVSPAQIRVRLEAFREMIGEDLL
jgi:benzoyl-CoA reductase/2-hydroxyglutaryl-CoA dehydratase subunit BcrC/BadD/HgdB